METTFEPVIASYHRARQSGQLFDAFYDLFLRKSPDIPLMFAQTDFRHQKLMLRESILEMLQFAETGFDPGYIQQLGERHRALNVKPAHYDLWLDALCEALALHDPEFDSTLERLWRDAMRKGIEVMAGRPR